MSERQELYCEVCHNRYFVRVASPHVLPDRICIGCHEKQVDIHRTIAVALDRIEQLAKEPPAPLTVVVPEWLIERYKAYYGDDWRRQLEQQVSEAGATVIELPAVAGPVTMTAGDLEG